MTYNHDRKPRLDVPDFRLIYDEGKGAGTVPVGTLGPSADELTCPDAARKED
jgi:hypothetical protein